MNITLPESVRDWVEAHGRFAKQSPDQYILGLVKEAQRHVYDYEAVLRGLIGAKVGEEVFAQRMAEAQQLLEAKLIEGLESGPAVPMDMEFREERRRILASRS